MISKPVAKRLPLLLRLRVYFLTASSGIVLALTAFTQPVDFVRRSGDMLSISGRPFYFLGTNAYYLLEQSARGDTATVKALLATAKSLNMTVIRTWGFFDSSDSMNPSVIQYRPGVFNERALRALDYVVYQARLHNLRLLIPFVNNWDDYGGMNQYVEWRSRIALDAHTNARARYTREEMNRRIDGGNGRAYRYATSAHFGHDDFYSDPLIRSWFKEYITMLVNRINIYTNTRYRDEPAIFGWELANEPRSSDNSTRLIHEWIREMARHVKTVDENHLLGTGEEGFERTSAGYLLQTYQNQRWLFDGSSGLAFRENSLIPDIDYATCHLYPESWGLNNGAGNAWIRDHVRVARLLGKPLVLGEFGTRRERSATYASWLTTALLDGASGALLWHLLEGPRANDGFGIRCNEETTLCAILGASGIEFAAKSNSEPLPVPGTYALRPNYPNPFNAVTTISYSLPREAHVDLSVFNSLGQQVATIVDGVQHAGERRELFDATQLASGAYFYRVKASAPDQPLRIFFVGTGRLVLLR